MSGADLEEICIGHLFFAGCPQQLSKNDLRVLREAGVHMLGCDSCIADKNNRKCPGYMPARLHIYNVSEKA